jgi:hypothetical protein
MSTPSAALRKHAQWAPVFSLFLSWAGRIVIACAAIAALTCSAGAQNFQQLGCLYHASDSKWWFAGIGLTPKASDEKFYSDYESYGFQVKAGDRNYTIPAEDVAVNVMRAFNFKGADKFKLLKYSLVIDYSSSIPVNTRTDIINFLNNFVDKLPLAVEGELVRFSDNVEKFSFTSSKIELKARLAQPIVYGMTALHDALMQGAQSLATEGPDTPVKVLILFTDGYENSSTIYKARDSFIASFTNLVKTEHIAVLAVGVTHEQDEALLRAITDPARGVVGHYLRVEDFDKFGAAMDQVKTMLENVVIFRMKKLGPDKGKSLISLMEKSKTSGNFTGTFHTFECSN